jgi:hypothetical protein
MPRVLDLIRNSEVPFNLMHAAARGSLAVPAAETIEILVYLALHHKLFGEQARMTLAGWDEKASLAAAADPNTSAEVLGYFIARENLRPVLLPALAENPSVSEAALDELAVSGSRSVLETLLTSTRMMNSPQLLQALRSNDKLRPKEFADIAKRLAALGIDSITLPDALEGNDAELDATDVDASDADASDEALENTVAQYLLENAAELAAEKEKPFRPIGMEHPDVGGKAAVEVGAQATPQTTPTSGASAEVAGKPAAAGTVTPAAAVTAHARKPRAIHEERRDSALQRISKLDIKSRIALAMRGNKEDRSILVRDSTKLVAVAVLDSPKVSESEVESFALQKNVLDSVLRAIPMKRKFAKSYAIMRNLVSNPRTPIDTSLPLVKGLLAHDLKNLAENKEVSDTIRKAAMRMYRQRLEKRS